MEQVHGDGCARQHPADGGREDRAHVDRDDLDGVAPGRRGAGQPVRGVIGRCGPRPGRAGPGSRPGRRSRRATGPRAARIPRYRCPCRQRGRPRRCSSMPRCATGAGSSSRVWSSGLAANAACADGHEMPASRAASAGVIPRSATSAPACSSSRRVIVQRGGSCGTDSVNVSAGQSFSAHSIRRLTRQKSVSCPQARTSRGCHRDILVHLFGNSPAARAHRGERDPGPDREPPVSLALRFRHFHAVHPEQHRRRILGRRGLVILDRHKSGSSGPRPHIRRTDTRHYVTD